MQSGYPREFRLNLLQQTAAVLLVVDGLSSEGPGATGGLSRAAPWRQPARSWREGGAIVVFHSRRVGAYEDGQWRTTRSARQQEDQWQI